ncbi:MULTISPECIES: type III secretion system export apparatus subunit SctS [Chromobacteriaceae]|uniref:EscS/YscS/HrcS family type III secretion system export apparatus protein n=3 Tax=Chromobacteriaceae TaxID=1499392 RepID=A0A1D9LLE9_9NEIS|nr:MULTISPECIES: type III secretion system export apparatus subunit SctS [Chromobacteriaceae]AOZ52138.1 EscS/YscS/HrcS family type III secretion system export apparatus protein [Chromobacterium vaccinii]AVG16470.1 EscS/YscS/HrcS family type III secretion system export apparatus protein [Chromobacterium vaccinii]ERE19467.1 flagellar biosynthesis protein FliQ [Pseudogulbenkiania ferrooxidans EGD-HP2]MBX9295063.1 type III secretion system export apparatus subunit SctS [Chromobacterium vaccinii]MB
MGQAQIVQLASELLWLVLILSLPVVVVASVVGVLVGLVQALTQVQDQTVSFLIKLVAACITLALTHHWMGQALLRYAERSFDLISRMGS